MDHFLGLMGKYALAVASGYLIGSIPLYSVLGSALPKHPRAAKLAGHVLDAAKAAVLFFAWFYTAGFHHHDVIVSDTLVYLAREILGPSSYSLGIVAGASAVVGQAHPMLRGHKGGSGVTPLVGLLLSSTWTTGLSFLLTWLAMRGFFRKTWPASVIAAVLTPAYLLLYQHIYDFPLPDWFWNVGISGPVEYWFAHHSADVFVVVATTAIALLIVWRHRREILRTTVAHGAAS